MTPNELQLENEGLRRRIAELEANDADQKLTRTQLLETEAQFRSFFDNAPIGKSVTSPDGKLIRVNPCFATLLGYSIDEMQELSFAAITHPDDLTESEECIRALLSAERDMWTMEKRYIAKDGHIVWTRVVTRLQRDEKNRPLYLLTHIVDITERKQADKKLLDQRTLLQNIIQSSGNAIFSLDSEYRYTSFNAQHANVMKALYGVDIEIGKSLLDYQRASGDDEISKRNLRRALNGESFTDEGYSGDDARTRSYFEVSHHPIVDEQGQIVGVAVFARDTTARRRAEEELRRVNEELDERVKVRTSQLEESNRELEAFSYSVSHDLRAPLRAIDGFTHILVEEFGSNLNEEGRRVCSVIVSNTRKMSTLIDELLTFSRQSRALMSPTRLDMNVIVQSAYQDLTTPSSRQRVDFQVSDLPSVVADPTLIRQVWINLLSNALKFTSKRDIAQIIVSAERINGAVKYAVTDNGAGFDMHYRDKLFGVFQRLHNSRDFEGNGVGLALVQRIIHRHEGQVWADGAVDRGASFQFSLPDERISL